MLAIKIPAAVPMLPNNNPSLKNIFRILFLLAPILCNTLMSFLFSSTSMVNALTILNAAMMSINVSTA